MNSLSGGVWSIRGPSAGGASNCTRLGILVQLRVGRVDEQAFVVSGELLRLRCDRKDKVDGDVLVRGRTKNEHYRRHERDGADAKCQNVEYDGCLNVWCSSLDLQ